jgi:hypothetical protein
LRNVVYNFCRQVRYAANVAGSQVFGSDPCRGKQEFPTHQQERSAFHAETCHTNCGDPASLGLSKSLLVNPRPLTRRTIGRTTNFDGRPQFRLQQPHHLLRNPHRRWQRRNPRLIRKSRTRRTKAPRISYEFLPNSVTQTRDSSLSSVTLLLARSLRECFRAQGARRQQHRAWPIKILTLAHSHGFNAVLYALTGSGLVTAGVKWFWPGTSQARLYAVGAIALAILLPLAYFFTRESVHSGQMGSRCHGVSIFL